MDDISERVYQIVARIPKGKVMSYGQVGVMTGIGPRQVGRILRNNPDNNIVPCHRVVHADGSIASGYAFGGMGEQKRRLVAEGVRFRGNRIAKECIV